MAIKKYMISQVVSLNGANVTSGFIAEMDEGDISTFLSNLEGKYTVMEENASLSGGTDTDQTAVNRVKLIKMYAKNADGHSLYANIRPYRGAIMVKNTISPDDLRTSLANIKPFALDATVKPTYIGINEGEKIVTSSDD